MLCERRHVIVKLADTEQQRIRMHRFRLLVEKQLWLQFAMTKLIFVCTAAACLCSFPWFLQERKENMGYAIPLIRQGHDVVIKEEVGPVKRLL